MPELRRAVTAVTTSASASSPKSSSPRTCFSTTRAPSRSVRTGWSTSRTWAISGSIRSSPPCPVPVDLFRFVGRFILQSDRIFVVVASPRQDRTVRGFELRGPGTVHLQPLRSAHLDQEHRHQCLCLQLHVQRELVLRQADDVRGRFRDPNKHREGLQAPGGFGTRGTFAF